MAWRWLALACCVAASVALTLPPSVSASVRAAPASAAPPRALPAEMMFGGGGGGGGVKLTNGAKSVSVGAGSSLMAACKKLGINVKTNCKKGDCGTCTVNVGGKSMRACIGKVPPAPKLKSVQEKGLPVRAR
jgi:hypothetical protein